MSRISLLTSVLIFTAACLPSVYNLDYSDLEALGRTCAPRDTCANYRNSHTFYDKNCECDSACDVYKDCCINALPATSSSRNRISQNDKVCLSYGGHTNTGVFVVNTCQRGWNGPAEVRQKCQGHDNIRDPLNAAPVVDTQRRVAYRNRYCSECNNVPSSRLTSFQVVLDCESLAALPNVTENYIWSNLEFNASWSKWGVNRWNPNRAALEFHVCDLHYNFSSHLRNSVRLCRSNIISTCPTTWRRMQVKRACESYQAVVYGNDDNVYKNPHCALCNGLTVDQYSCFTGEISGKRKPMSFALLLDVNQNDGDEVGMSRQSTPSCPARQKYDPFFKKCRALTCVLPGYKMVNGRCVNS